MHNNLIISKNTILQEFQDHFQVLELWFSAQKEAGALKNGTEMFIKTAGGA